MQVLLLDAGTVTSRLNMQLAEQGLVESFMTEISRMFESHSGTPGLLQKWTLGL